MKTVAHINSVEVIKYETFFHVEMNNDEVTIAVNDMENLIKNPNIEVTYDEDFITKDEELIEQIIDNLRMDHAEVTDFETDGEYDVYLHKVTTRYGKVSYDIEGQYIGSWKTEKTAIKKALQVAPKIK